MLAPACIPLSPDASSFKSRQSGDRQLTSIDSGAPVSPHSNPPDDHRRDAVAPRAGPRRRQDSSQVMASTQNSPGQGEQKPHQECQLLIRVPGASDNLTEGHLPGLKESEPPDSFHTIKGSGRLGEPLGMDCFRTTGRGRPVACKAPRSGTQFLHPAPSQPLGPPSTPPAVSAQPGVRVCWEGGLSAPLPLCTLKECLPRALTSSPAGP